MNIFKRKINWFVLCKATLYFQYLSKSLMRHTLDVDQTENVIFLFCLYLDSFIKKVPNQIKFESSLPALHIFVSDIKD